ncbi:MAG: AarF/ABC1/UbiB kinase family protein [Pseudomonadota bacterium]|nr:AarF/ABC1/UbiB kinase family protein [Pseudomonadota bacterium]
MTNPDDNTLRRRTRRYARVGSAVGGLAARFVGSRYLGLNLDKDKHAGELTAALGGLKGPLMKVAQLMATIPDALPDEYVRELKQLQADAPAMGWPFVRRRMAAELGPDWRSRFETFEREAAHAASLGQVHKATGTDGTLYACKLQYPDMTAAVEADLNQLKLVFGIYARTDKAIDTSNIHTEISSRLREELDYNREGRHMALYRDMLEFEENVHVPKRVDELSTDRLLTMSWLDGEPLMNFADEPLETRNLVAYNMFRAWYLPFYEYAVIHGDPHLGNYSVRNDHSINLLDFGCVRVFKASFVRGVIDLYYALRDGDRNRAAFAYETWGFEAISDELIDILNIWAEFVYAPLLRDEVRKIQDTNNGLYGANVANKVHAELRKLGGVRPPREFVFMDRAAIGLGSVFMHLRAEINWHKMFHGLVDNFDEEMLAEKQAYMLKNHHLDEP